MTRRRVVLTGNSGWTTRVAANSSRYFSGSSSASQSKPKKRKKPKVQVAKDFSPEKREEMRARLLTLLAKTRAAYEDGDYALVPPLWGQAKGIFGELYGAEAVQLGIYKEMNSQYAWARSLLNAKKKARKDGASSGAADPSRAPVAPSPPQPGRTDVRAGRCIHDLAIDQCAYCLPPLARKASSIRSRG